MMTREDILSATDEQILKEVQDFQYLYRMHGIIRYDQTRQEEVRSESVSEHTYAMTMLAHYFLPFEESEHNLDRQKVYELITWHDIAEIETGDKVTFRKDQTDEQEELDVLSQVYSQFPEHMRQHVKSLVDEYEALETSEAQFVKALDQAEPWFSNMDVDGRARIIDVCQTTKENLEFAIEKKKRFAKQFKTIYRFADEVGKYLIEEEYHL